MHSKPAENYIGILSKEEFLRQKEFNIEDCFSDYSSFYNQKLHFHDFYELSVVYEGNALYDINGIHVPMKRGTMQLITPAGYHRQLIQAGEYLRYFNFMFTAEILTEEMRAALSSGEAPLFTILCQAEFEYVLALSQRLLLSQGNASSTVRIFVKRGIEFLCAILLKSIKEDGLNVNKLSKDPMQAAITYIQKNYRSPVTLAATAMAAGFSPAYFSAHFHKCMGISFSQYLSAYRLSIACRYLKCSNLSVKEIADACGFSSYAHFLSCFKNQYGHSPANYRKQIHAAGEE